VDVRIYSNPNDTALVLPSVLGRAITNIDAHGNALNQSSVDNLLHKIRNYYVGNGTVASPQRPPTTGLTIDIGRGTNSPPTGGDSNQDILDLNTMFTAALKSLSISHR